MDIPSARVLIRTAYICSNCEMALRLKVGDGFPKSCPYCGVVFMFGNANSSSIDTVQESVVSLKNGAFLYR